MALFNANTEHQTKRPKQALFVKANAPKIYSFQLTLPPFRLAVDFGERQGRQGLQ